MKAYWIGSHLNHELNVFKFSFDMIKARIDKH